jgi:pyruvate dehydrogenase E2 component (dihydrolipoamide acetyltransferase)
MPVSVTMPRLGESVTEGTVTRWLKQEGDHVDADEPLLEVSTDKVDTEVPSPASGTLLAIKVAEDETVEIGVELAVIGDAGESADTSGASTSGASAGTATEAPAETPAEAPAEAPAAGPPAEQAPAEPEPQPAPVAEPEAPADNVAAANANPARSGDTAPSEDEDVAGAYVTPLVRKLASEHGVDLRHRRGRPYS